MARLFTILAGLLGLLGVLAGTFGAHGLERYAKPDDLAVWDTGSRYHMYHALALLGIAWAAERFGSRAIGAAGWLFIIGIAIFSGSLYLLALSESLLGERQAWLGAIAPLGGLCFIAGWVCLFVGGFLSPPQPPAR